jgi:hypothetical protein
MRVPGGDEGILFLEGGEKGFMILFSGISL